MNASKDHADGRDEGLLQAVPAQRLREESRRGWRDLRDLVLFGGRREAVPSYLGTVEPPEAGKTGICCSGGGIRSAAYNLGALQALHRYGAVREARYVAAVSGGSYIAAAMAMVGKTWPGGGGAPRPPEPAAGWDDSDPAQVTDQRPPFHRGSPEEQYLRNRSSYLAPGIEGKLFLVYRVLLGMAWNIAFMVLFLIAAGSAAALYYREAYRGLAGRGAPATSCSSVDVAHTCRYVADVPGGWRVVLAGLLIASVAGGAVALLAPIHHDHLRRAFEVWSVRLLLGAGSVAVLFVLLPLMVQAARNYNWQTNDTTSFTLNFDSPLGKATTTSIVTLFTAALAQVRARVAEPARVLQDVRRGRKMMAKLGRRCRMLLAYVAVGIAGPLLTLVVLVAVISKALAADSAALWPPVIAGAVFAAFYLAADLTSWSLHPFYKRRLCTAFALKRVTGHVGDREVPVATERDYDKLVLLSQTGVRIGDRPWPTLLVCAAANISDCGATPPGRGVTSFTFSPTAIGGPLVGATATTEMEETVHHSRQRAFTLPAAVAMSGAALSPSMGKMTRRPLTFLMAMLNVRLGVWVPNPRRIDAWRKRHPLRDAARRLGLHRLAAWRVPNRAVTWIPFIGDELVARFRSRRKLINPRPHPSYLLRELLGMNRLNGKYLYVTDGGHYENLGLVELLRRGCTDVYCFDASGGEGFAQLGDAVALARSELGVEIDIDPTCLVPEGEHQLARCDCVRGTITYGDPDRTTGTLIYARTVMTASAPWDVHAYHDADHTFPHDPTADQLYTDQKFEAYRALGECAGAHAHDLMHRAPGEPAYGPATGEAPGPVLTPPPLGGNGAVTLTV